LSRCVQPIFSALLAEDVEPVYIEIGGERLDCRYEFSLLQQKSRRRQDHYLATKNVAIQYGFFEPGKNNTNPSIKDCLWEENNAFELDVLTNIGLIDCISALELIEIKHVSLWKYGLGQLMAYVHGPRDRKKILYLFDSQRKDKLLSKIEPVYSGLDIEVRFELVG